MNLFTQIEELVPKLHGWCDVDKAKTLACLVMGLRPKLTIEIGVWGGRSLIPMALAHKEINYGRVLGIDPWNAQSSVEGQINPNDLTYWGSQANHEMVYRSFIKALEDLQLKGIVDVLRKRSDEMMPPKVIELIHIDANHGPQAIRDVGRYCPWVRIGGIVVMDDLNWSGGNVLTAVQNLEKMGFHQLYLLGTGAVYQKVK